jgi:hypothetical protein
VAGALFTGGQATIQTLRVGLGAGSIASNTAVGFEVLNANTTGFNNTATGYGSLKNNTTGHTNVASGYETLLSNTSGSNNTANGYRSLWVNTTGNANTAIGYGSLSGNTSGSNNTAVGVGSLNSITTGIRNTAIGSDAGLGITTGNYNTIIGSDVTGLATTLASTVIIADGAGGAGSYRFYSPSSGNVLLGTTTDSSNGKLQLTSHTTSAGGIGFGTDVNLYRSEANVLKTDDSLVITGTLTSTVAEGNALTDKAVGYRNIPQNSKSAAYTLVAADAGKHIYHPSADTTARTWTIPANGSVGYAIGTAITFVNDTSAGSITIAITTDTLVLAGAGTTGSRTLAANGVATAIKVTATRWMISGTNLT